MSNERTFPIQFERGAAPHHSRIPWSVAELAYSVYAGKYGSSQRLERLAERGGFCPSEMDEFLPDWRERCSEIVALRKRVQVAEDAHRAELAAHGKTSAELSRVCADLEDAASAIPDVAGPVADRIRVLRNDLSEQLIALRKRVEELESLVGAINARAEKAERERDSYRRDFDGAAHACDKLQADLDAARAGKEKAELELAGTLDLLDAWSRNKDLPDPGPWQRVKALLAARKEAKRG